MNKFFLLAAFTSLSLTVNAQSVTQHFQELNTENISEKGIFFHRVKLKGNSLPEVKVTNVKTKTLDKLPANVARTNSFEPDVFLGTERKQSTLTVQLPVYRIVNNLVEQLVSFDLEISEPEVQNNNTAQRPTGADESVLATGVWYKFAVKNKGVYKLDYAFLQSLTGNAGAINPQNIRIYGNGGTVLPEAVTEDQPDDLIENAVFVSSSGSTFGNNDYILFYANGPVAFNPDETNKRFTRTPNYYENQSYYFINFDIGPGKRIATEPSLSNASYTSVSFNDYWLYEGDSANLVHIGKAWFSNRMNSMNPASLTQTIPVNLGGVIPTEPVYLSTIVANSNLGFSSMAIRANNKTVANINLNAVALPTVNYSDNVSNALFQINDNSLPATFNLEYRYQPGGTGSGYIDYALINYRRPLTFGGGQLSFRDWNTTGLGTGQNATYSIGSATNNTTVWDVTNPLSPVAVTGSSVDGGLKITRPADKLREFIAFDGSQFLQPTFISATPVPNQNLHALPQMDYLIVTAPEFINQATELAAFHTEKYGTKVAVVTTTQVYNEFSSGSQDIGGIRNLVKLFYDRADNEAEMPKNLLLFGAASYDYKDRLAYNTNFVPVYQSEISIGGDNSFSTDDFFALLDQGENVNTNAATNILDIGVGRMPVVSEAEAKIVVAKVKHYVSAQSFGPWKNNVAYVADDWELFMNHLRDCETVNVFFEEPASNFNVYKIYSDAYTKVPSPSGSRYPSVNKAINDQIYNGTLLMSYTGHGSPERWSHEAILTATDYGNWTNIDKLPLMITATCDFGRFDYPDERSAGVKLFVSSKGGSIALITTTQAVYPGPNTKLNTEYIKAQFEKVNGKLKTFGEALKDAKNQPTTSVSNNYKYVVLGDPALTLALPTYKVVTKGLSSMENGTAIAKDTINALGHYALEGSVVDENNNTLTNFNGNVYITIFDKSRKISSTNNVDVPNFSSQTNVVAKVNGTVTNGEFSVQFIAPKDIVYDFGKGRISYYANSATHDAAGLDTTLTIGGYNENAQADNDAPIVLPYIDNEKFRNGGITGPNPLLYVKFYDDNGINVSGTSIGHDLVAILDEDVQNPFVMNNYYQTLPNDYRNGYVNFPLYNLPEGKHTLRVRAWDVYNNSGEGTVTFEVKNKDKGFISDLYNYPNPFTDVTHIVFQHNQEGEEMDVTVQIYNTAGALVYSNQEHITATGNRTELIWDGKGNNGVPINKGVYFYKLQAKTSKGITATAYQKLVLLR